MTEYKTMDDLGDLHGKVVMLRADLNVPMDENFHVTNTARIDRTVPTVKELMEKGAKVVVISHFGRPEGKGDMKNSLSHIVGDLEKALGKKLFSLTTASAKSGSRCQSHEQRRSAAFGNLRFYSEEKKATKLSPNSWLHRPTFMFPTLSPPPTAPMLRWLPRPKKNRPQWGV